MNDKLYIYAFRIDDWNFMESFFVKANNDFIAFREFQLFLARSGIYEYSNLLMLKEEYKGVGEYGNDFKYLNVNEILLDLEDEIKQCDSDYVSGLKRAIELINQNI